MNKKIILYIISGILILGILIMTFFPGMIYLVRDSGDKTTDKCTPGPGYTQAEWEEHMGHHPSMYEECLK